MAEMLVRGVALVILMSIHSSSQSVISTHSGLVDYFEGAVSIDGRAIAAISGRFPEVPAHAQLSTEDGKAEVVLNPEVLLWIGPRSAIRLERNSLDDTWIELLEGSAVVQSEAMSADDPVTLIYRNSQVRVSAQSLYRADTSSCRLNVLTGRADVAAGDKRVVITGPAFLNFCSSITGPLPPGAPDALDNWVHERRKLLAKWQRSGRNDWSRRRHPFARPFPSAVPSLPRRAW